MSSLNLQRRLQDEYSRTTLSRSADPGYYLFNVSRYAVRARSAGKEVFSGVAGLGAFFASRDGRLVIYRIWALFRLFSERLTHSSSLWGGFSNLPFNSHCITLYYTA